MSDVKIETVPIERFRELVKTNEKHYQEAIALRAENARLQGEVSLFKEAVAVLDGRVGILSDSVVTACREYVATEDELPDIFDTEDYCLSKAVKSLVADNAHLREARDHLDSQHRTLLQQKNAMQADLRSHRTALLSCRDALDSAWACIWDGQLSGKGVTKEYAQSASDEIKNALTSANSVLK